MNRISRMTGWVLALAVALTAWPTAGQVTNLESLVGSAPTRQGPAERIRLSTMWNRAAASPGDTVVLAIPVAMDPLWHINPDPDQVVPVGTFRPLATTVAVEAPPGVTAGAVQFPPPKAIEVNYVDGELLAFSDGVVFYVPVRVEPDAEPGTVTLQVAVRYQACNDRVCLPPKTVTLQPTLEIVADASAVPPAPEHGDLFTGFDASAATFDAAPPTPHEPAEAPEPANPTPAAADPALAPAAAPTGLATILVLAFVGGALLNIMPCVLPVIPIKILGLVHAAPEPGRRIMLGLTMSAGVVAFWIVLGLVVATVAGSAISILFSKWWFNFLLGGLIVVLGVGMLGLFATGLPRWVYAINPKHDSYPGSFGFGVMTAVLATPCTGLFMGGAAGAVIGAGPVLAFAVFAAIGLGMALPYGVLTAAPQLVDRLPRTGPASELVKQVLGLLMVAAGVFFLGAGVNALLSDGSAGVYQWYWWASAAVVAVAGAWLILRTVQITARTGRRLAFGVLGLAMVGGSMGMAWDFTRPSDIHWVYYTPERFEQALADGHVVMMDFTADWCINCKVLERAVLETQPVISALADPEVVAMKVDLTGDHPEGWAKLREAGRVAIPLLVVYAPDGTETLKAEVYTVDQVVTGIDEAKR